MSSNSITEQTTRLVDQAANAADSAIRSTQRVANNALDGLAVSVAGAQNSVTPAIERAGEQASALAQRGVDAVRDSAQGLRESATRATDSTVMYIKDEPLKAMLIAAAAGAALMALIGLLSRSGPRG